jgi:hypothetical protein
MLIIIRTQEAGKIVIFPEFKPNKRKEPEQCTLRRETTHFRKTKTEPLKDRNKQ